jgi:shikimate dehydrogenase
MKKKIGIVAEKLSHSLSPIIHNYWMKINKIDAEYICYEIKPNEINQFYKDFKKDNNFLGFNVTVPYKENFFRICENINDRAENIGSINLVYKNNKKIYGDNTDYIGFAKTYKNLVKRKINKILLIGAGGAARSILQFLNDEDINQIDIFTRSLNKKKTLSRSIKFNNFIIDSKELRGKSYDLIINASDAGMIGRKNLASNVYKLASNTSYVIDIVYNPMRTKLIDIAKANNVSHDSGLGMLLEQAKPSFEAWFKTEISISQYLRNKLKSKLNHD